MSRQSDYGSCIVTVFKNNKKIKIQTVREKADKIGFMGSDK